MPSDFLLSPRDIGSMPPPPFLPPTAGEIQRLAAAEKQQQEQQQIKKPPEIPSGSIAPVFKKVPDWKEFIPEGDRGARKDIIVNRLVNAGAPAETIAEYVSKNADAVTVGSAGALNAVSQALVTGSGTATLGQKKVDVKTINPAGSTNIDGKALTAWQISEFNKMGPEQQREFARELGIKYPEASIDINKELGDAIQKQDPYFYKVYQEQGYDAYVKAVDDRNQAIEIYNRKIEQENANITSENKRKFEAAIVTLPPEVQVSVKETYKTDPEAAVKIANNYIQGVRTQSYQAQRERSQVMTSLQGYRDSEGNYDIAKYLRDFQGNEKAMENLEKVFSDVSIKKAQEFNRENFGVGFEKRDIGEFIEEYYQKKGWTLPTTASTATAQAGSTAFQRMVEAQEAYKKQYWPKVDYGQFEAGYFTDKGWDLPGGQSGALYGVNFGLSDPESVKERNLYFKRQKEAIDAYVDRFGATPLVNQTIENVIDVTVPGYYVATKWDQLSDVEKGINIAIDALFVGALLSKPLGAAVRALEKAENAIGRQIIKALDSAALRVSQATGAQDVLIEGWRLVKAGRELVKAGDPLGELLIRNGENLMRNADAIVAIRNTGNTSVKNMLKNVTKALDDAVKRGEAGFRRVDELLGREITPPRGPKPGERVKLGERIPRSEEEALLQKAGLSEREIDDVLKLKDTQFRRDVMDDLNRTLKENDRRYMTEKEIRQSGIYDDRYRPFDPQALRSDLGSRAKSAPLRLDKETAQQVRQLRRLRESKARLEQVRRVQERQKAKLEAERQQAARRQQEQRIGTKPRTSEKLKTSLLPAVEGATQYALVWEAGRLVVKKIKPQVQQQGVIKELSNPKELTKTQIKSLEQRLQQLRSKTKTLAKVETSTKGAGAGKGATKGMTSAATKGLFQARAKVEAETGVNLQELAEFKLAPAIYEEYEQYKATLPELKPEQVVDRIKPIDDYPPEKFPPDPEKLKGKKPIVPRGKHKPAAEWSEEDIASAIAWKDGIVIHAIRSPYRRGIDEKTYSVKRVPAGLKVIESHGGKGSEQRSIKATGKTPRVITVDVGNQDKRITRTKSGRIRISSSLDRGSRTRSDLTVKKTRNLSKKKGRVYHTRMGGSTIISRRGIRGR